MTKRILPKNVLLTLVIVSAIALTLAIAGVSNAFSTGISGFSGINGITCTTCHSGGLAPTVVLDGPTTVAPGETADYSLRITSNAPDTQIAAGLNVAATDGALAGRGSYTQVMNGEITHTSPKPNNASGFTTFQFSWTAPDSEGEVTLYAAGNSVNLSGDTTGDLPNTDTLTIQVTSPTSVTMTELAGAPGRIPWLLLGSVSAACLFAALLSRRFASHLKA